MGFLETWLGTGTVLSVCISLAKTSHRSEGADKCTLSTLRLWQVWMWPEGENWDQQLNFLSHPQPMECLLCSMSDQKYWKAIRYSPTDLKTHTCMRCDPTVPPPAGESCAHEAKSSSELLGSELPSSMRRIVTLIWAGIMLWSKLDLRKSGYLFYSKVKWYWGRGFRGKALSVNSLPWDNQWLLSLYHILVVLCKMAPCPS